MANNPPIEDQKTPGQLAWELQVAEELRRLQARPATVATGTVTQMVSEDTEFFAGTFVVYRRSDSAPATPSDSTFNRTNGEWPAPAGWSKTEPAGSETLYTSIGSAIGSDFPNVTIVFATPTQIEGTDGADGQPGAPGRNGTSARVEVRKVGGVATVVAINDSDGVITRDSENVEDGQDGMDGMDGAPGSGTYIAYADFVGIPDWNGMALDNTYQNFPGTGALTLTSANFTFGDGTTTIDTEIGNIYFIRFQTGGTTTTLINQQSSRIDFTVANGQTVLTTPGSTTASTYTSGFFFTQAWNNFYEGLLDGDYAVGRFVPEQITAAGWSRTAPPNFVDSDARSDVNIVIPRDWTITHESAAVGAAPASAYKLTNNSNFPQTLELITTEVHVITSFDSDDFRLSTAANSPATVTMDVGTGVNQNNIASRTYSTAIAVRDTDAGYGLGGFNSQNRDQALYAGDFNPYTRLITFNDANIAQRRLPLQLYLDTDITVPAGGSIYLSWQWQGIKSASAILLRSVLFSPRNDYLDWANTGYVSEFQRYEHRWAIQPDRTYEENNFKTQGDYYTLTITGFSEESRATSEWLGTYEGTARSTNAQDYQWSQVKQPAAYFAYANAITTGLTGGFFTRNTNTIQVNGSQVQRWPSGGDQFTDTTISTLSRTDSELTYTLTGDGTVEFGRFDGSWTFTNAALAGTSNLMYGGDLELFVNDSEVYSRNFAYTGSFSNVERTFSTSEVDDFNPITLTQNDVLTVRFRRTTTPASGTTNLRINSFSMSPNLNAFDSDDTNFAFASGFSTTDSSRTYIGAASTVLTPTVGDYNWSRLNYNVTVPSSNSASGELGEYAVSSTHFYAHDGTRWRRVAWDTWN